MKKQYLSIIGLALFLGLMSLQLIYAFEFDGPISTTDQATFDQMLRPVMKIYNLVKYVASAIAGVILLFAGISYMTSGSDPRARENAKSMAMYVIIGLIVIWAAPLIVNFLIG